MWLLEKTRSTIYQGQTPLGDPCIAEFLFKAAPILECIAKHYGSEVLLLCSLFHVSRHLRSLALAKLPFVRHNDFKFTWDFTWHTFLTQKSWILLSKYSAVFLQDPHPSTQTTVRVVNLSDIWSAIQRAQFHSTERLQNLVHVLLFHPPADLTRAAVKIALEKLTRLTLIKKGPSKSRTRELSRWRCKMLAIKEIHPAWKSLFSNRSNKSVIEILTNQTTWESTKPRRKRMSELESLSPKRIKR